MGYLYLYKEKEMKCVEEDLRYIPRNSGKCSRIWCILTWFSKNLCFPEQYDLLSYAGHCSRKESEVLFTKL